MDEQALLLFDTHTFRGYPGYMTLRILNPKQRLFIEAYAGDEIKAMRLAGYNGSDAYLQHQAEKLLKEPLILEAIHHRDFFMDKSKKLKMDREDIQGFWTEIIKNNDPYQVEEFDPVTNVPKPKENLPIQARLKASEMLGKSDGMFVDKIDISGNVTITDLVQQSLKSTRSVEDIEAEYNLIKAQDELLPEPTELHNYADSFSDIDDLI
jgi:phage terminase small subunit